MNSVISAMFYIVLFVVSFIAAHIAILQLIQRTYPVERRWIWVKNLRRRAMETVWQAQTFYVANRLWIRVYVVESWRWSSRKKFWLKFAGSVLAIIFVSFMAFKGYHLYQQHEEESKLPYELLIKADKWSKIIALEDLLDIKVVPGRKVLCVTEDGYPLAKEAVLPEEVHCKTPIDGVKYVRLKAGDRPFYVVLRGRS